MSTSKQSRFEAALARISLGAVPMDGILWIDPKGYRSESRAKGGDANVRDAAKGVTGAPAKAAKNAAGGIAAQARATEGRSELSLSRVDCEGECV